jgi:hypothetical protein
MVSLENARSLALGLPEAVEQDHAAVRVELDAVDANQLADLLADAWEDKAPARLNASRGLP